MLLQTITWHLREAGKLGGGGGGVAGLFSQLASVLGRTQTKFKRLGVGLLLPPPPTRVGGVDLVSLFDLTP